MGVILYALLCGELPFDHEDESVTKEKIIKREYTLPDFLSSGKLLTDYSNHRCKIVNIVHVSQA
jgi:hypothetical protein